MKKINKALENPTVRYVGGSLLSLAAVGTLRLMAEKIPQFAELLVSSNEERNKAINAFYSEDEIQI